MFRVGGVGLERSVVGEFGEQNDVAGVVDITDVETDFDMGEAVDPAA